MNFEQLAQDALQQACTTQFPAPQGATTPDELRIAAVIGFAGDHVRGTLGIAASEAGLDRIRTHFGAADDPAAAADSLGEVANLVLGHIKRNWGSYDVQITISTPLVMRGVAIEICGSADGSWHEFDSKDGGDRVSVWLDAHVSEGIEISEEKCEEAVMGEGDALLF